MWCGWWHLRRVGTASPLSPVREDGSSTDWSGRCSQLSALSATPAVRRWCTVLQVREAHATIDDVRRRMQRRWQRS